MFNLFFDSKGYGVKIPTLYVLDLVCLTSLNIEMRVLQWGVLYKVLIMSLVYLFQ